MKNILGFLFIMLLFTISCTEKPVVVPEFIAPDSDRVVLLEELTGVRCPNCPSGAAKVEDLLQLYDGQLVVMAVHGEFDAEPLEESKYDFRSEEAKALEDHLKPFWGKPAAAINRVVDENGNIGVIGVDNWGGLIEEELAKDHEINLEMSVEFDEESRDLEVNLGIIPLKNLEGTFNISVAITESHIIDAQLNQATVIPDFEHMHVFRKMLTDVTGNQLSNSMIKNEVINRSFTYTLPTHESLWRAENCHVIAFVSKLEGDSKEVLQAVEAAVVD